MTDGEFEMRIRRQESFLLAQDGQFLGILSSNKYQTDSVMNEYGTYGSKYSSTSIFNQYSQYGSRYGFYSPFNPYTSTPPQIILKGLMGRVYSLRIHFLQNRLDPHSVFLIGFMIMVCKLYTKTL